MTHISRPCVDVCLDEFKFHTRTPTDSYLDALANGVERREVGVDGGDVAEEGCHGGVVVVLPCQPRVDQLLTCGNCLGLQM